MTEPLPPLATGPLDPPLTLDKLAQSCDLTRSAASAFVRQYGAMTGTAFARVAYRNYSQIEFSDAQFAQLQRIIRLARAHRLTYADAIRRYEDLPRPGNAGEPLPGEIVARLDRLLTVLEPGAGVLPGRRPASGEGAPSGEDGSGPEGAAALAGDVEARLTRMEVALGTLISGQTLWQQRVEDSLDVVRLMVAEIGERLTAGEPERAAPGGGERSAGAPGFPDDGAWAGTSGDR